MTYYFGKKRRQSQILFFFEYGSPIRAARSLALSKYICSPTPPKIPNFRCVRISVEEVHDLIVVHYGFLLYSHWVELHGGGGLPSEPVGRGGRLRGHSSVNGRGGLGGRGGVDRS